MKREICFLSLAATVFILMGCGQNQQSDSSESLPSNDTNHIRKKIEPIKVQSVQKQEISLDDFVLALFFGHFEPTKISNDLNARYDSMENAIVDDNDYFTLEDRFYKSTSDFEKNYFYLDPLYGVYRLRRPNAISIILEQMTVDSLIGRSICAGNERPLYMQSLVQVDDTIKLTVAEPGSEFYDGIFEMDLVFESGTLSGRFLPYHDKLPTKSFRARSINFEYKPEGEEWAFDSDYFGKNISLERLTEEDVENQSKQRLRILRNIIYARHGYSFKNKDVREFFESYDWYVPYATDIRDELTEIELENIAMIKRYEEYAEDYYDDFGR